MRNIHRDVFFGFCLSVIFVIPATSQKENDIYSISISGNTKTKSSFLQRFIYTSSGDQYDSLKINNDLRRLRTLAPVMDVKIDTAHLDSGIVVDYKFAERMTIFPVGDFGITNNNFWIGIGAMESNLAGRGMYIYGFYRYNADHTVHFIFRNQYIRGSKWGFELQTKNLPATEYIHADTAIKYHYTDISAACKYELHFENDLFFGTSFRYRSAKYIINNEEYTENTIIGLRRSVVLFLRWEFQKLDIRYFYIHGWKNNLYAETSFSLQVPNKSVLLFYDELRLYGRLGEKGNLAFRILAGISNEEYVVFSPFIADSYYNFRGIGYRAFKGNTIGLLNLEYRQTAFENHFGGIQAVLFSDIGTLLNNGSLSDSSLKYKRVYTFGGIGARFIFKKAYNAILSIDYGMDLQNITSGGWVFGWGQYF